MSLYKRFIRWIYYLFHQHITYNGVKYNLNDKYDYDDYLLVKKQNRFNFPEHDYKSNGKKIVIHKDSNKFIDDGSIEEEEGLVIFGKEDTIRLGSDSQVKFGKSDIERINMVNK